MPIETLEAPKMKSSDYTTPKEMEKYELLVDRPFKLKKDANEEIKRTIHLELVKRYENEIDDEIPKKVINAMSPDKATFNELLFQLANLYPRYRTFSEDGEGNTTQYVAMALVEIFIESSAPKVKGVKSTVVRSVQGSFAIKAKDFERNFEPA